MRAPHGMLLCPHYVAPLFSTIATIGPLSLAVSSVFSTGVFLTHLSSLCVQLTPENTLMSFRRSVGCDVIAFETDVQLRYPGD